MPFDIIRSDITTLDVDAIVNTVNANFEIGEGVDRAIHSSAGSELAQYLSIKESLEVNEVIITPGFNLKARHIIHIVGPRWLGGFENEEKLYEQCYTNVLQCVIKNKLSSVAIPLISTGFHRFPKDRALKIAMAVINKFILKYDIHVTLVVFDITSYMLSQKLVMYVENYITNRFKEPDYERNFNMRAMSMDEEFKTSYREVSSNRRSRNIDDIIAMREETFSQRLLRYIDRSGLSDAAVYHKANIDRRLFSKIRSNENYQPSKPTVLAFIIALELNLDETQDLLLSAGYALSSSHVLDLIIEYFIEEKKYDIMEINAILFHFNQPLLGS